jgi:hypothetical protein
MSTSAAASLRHHMPHDPLQLSAMVVRENRLIKRAIADASSWCHGHARTTCAQLVPSSSRLELCLAYARHPCRSIRAQYRLDIRNVEVRRIVDVTVRMRMAWSAIWHKQHRSGMRMMGRSGKSGSSDTRMDRRRNESNKTVKRLMNASIKAGTGDREEKEAERASTRGCTPSSVASTTDASTCCPANSTYGLTAVSTGATPPLHASDTLGPSRADTIEASAASSAAQEERQQQGATTGDNSERIGA